MQFDGIIIGGVTFLIIGAFHPIVIWGEYYFGKAVWPLFLAAGAACVIAAVFIDASMARALLGITGFTFLWSIIELFHQQERVKKGWYPENPKRKSYRRREL